MGSIMGEERLLDNCDSSLLTSPLKYKRRKVSVVPLVCDFPTSCGPNAASLCNQTKAKEVQGVDGLDVDDVVDPMELADAAINSMGEEGAARSNVRETLKLYQALVRMLLQEQETKPKENGKAMKRVDIHAADKLKEKGKYIKLKKVKGAVPGVEIGDFFNYRIELAIAGIHGPLQSGIDTMKQGKGYIAISVVASGRYDNDVDSSDVLIYTGQGGMGADKKPEDQKLAGANLALKNCIDKMNPVRVTRGFKEAKPGDNANGKPKMIATYTYDGLYNVERYWQELGKLGLQV